MLDFLMSFVCSRVQVSGFHHDTKLADHLQLDLGTAKSGCVLLEIFDYFKVFCHVCCFSEILL